VAIIFPLIVLAHDYLFRKNINWLAASGHALLVVIYLVSRYLALSPSNKGESLNISHLSRAVDFALGYSEMLMLPARIPFYIQPPLHSVSSAIGWISVISIVMILVFAWRAFEPNGRKLLVFSSVWTIAFFWPAMLMMFYMEGFYSARFLYVPALGISVTASILYGHLVINYPRLKIAIIASAGLFIGHYGAMTWKEIPDWHDDTMGRFTGRS